MEKVNMRLRAGACVVAALALSGCATTSDKLLVPEAGAQSISFTSKSAEQGIVGYEAVKISVTQNKTPLSDVACTLEGSGFTAAVTAPAEVNLPSYGAQSKPVRLTCAGDGGAYQKVFAAKNLSAEKRSQNAMATGVLLSPIMGGVMAADAARVQEGDAFGYGTLELKI